MKNRNVILKAKKAGNILMIAVSTLSIILTVMLFMSFGNPPFSDPRIIETGIIPVTVVMGSTLILIALCMIIYHTLSLFQVYVGVKSWAQNAWRILSFLPVTILSCVLIKDEAERNLDFLTRSLEIGIQLLVSYTIASAPCICVMHIFYRNTFVTRVDNPAIRRI